MCGDLTETEDCDFMKKAQVKEMIAAEITKTKGMAYY